MIDGMPVAVMTADPAQDFRINYLNRTSTEIMRRIQKHLPVSADNLLGQSIDIFHVNAAHQRAVLSDPANLPFKARIAIGDEVLSLEATAIMSDDGRYVGPMVTWGLVTEQARLSARVSDLADALATSFESLRMQATLLDERARHKAALANDLAGVADRMETASQIISSHIQESSRLTDYISDQALKTQQVVTSLEERASAISTMSAGIAEIAAQTKLLSLNATIEAARAGDAGRGFAVVAQEVKALAAQTARTNADISQQVAAMQAATTEAAAAIRSISDEIVRLSAAAERARSANAQQGHASQAVTASVSDMQSAVTDMAGSAEFVTELAIDLSDKAALLRSELGNLLA